MKLKKIIVGICGASGVIYGIRLLKYLLNDHTQVHLIISTSGKKVLEHETGYKGEKFDIFLRKNNIEINSNATLYIHDNTNFFTPPASGSFLHDGMVIAPCSMKTLGAIATGISDNLITRSADVSLKEKRPLILLPREMPLHSIHLENMQRANRAGATIIPPCPSFYSGPETIIELIDTVIARTLDHLDIKHTILKQWGEDTII